jgi:hypothetical protein
MGGGGSAPLQGQSPTFIYRLARVPENGTVKVVHCQGRLIQEVQSYGRTILFFNKR